MSNKPSFLLIRDFLVLGPTGADSRFLERFGVDSEVEVRAGEEVRDCEKIVNTTRGGH